VHVKSFADQTHMCTHNSNMRRWVWEAHPHWALLDSSRVGGQQVRSVRQNRAQAEGRGRGASLLKGSCNFHSRVLLKLVPRPLPRLNTLLYARLLALQPGSSLYLFTSVIRTGKRMALCWSVCVDEWALIFQTTCTQQTSLSFFFGCLKILIIVVDMVSIFF